MTDERTECRMRAGGFDDDRLLACALGLDDDPELLGPPRRDVELGARLAAMRADVARSARRSAPPCRSRTRRTPTSPASAGAASRSTSRSRRAPPRRAVSAAGGASSRRSRRSPSSPSSPAWSPWIAASPSPPGRRRGPPRRTSRSSDPPSRSAERPRGPTSPTEQFADQLDRFAVVVLARPRARPERCSASPCSGSSRATRPRWSNSRSTISRPTREGCTCSCSTR